MEVVERIKVPVQGHYGLLDKVAPVADAQAFEGKLKAQKTPVEMFCYAGAGHGFMRDGSSSFDEPAATDAWSRTLAFFSQHLR